MELGTDIASQVSGDDESSGVIAYLGTGIINTNV